MRGPPEMEARDLWAVLPVPALLVGADGRIIDQTPAAESLLNLSARALSGRDLLQVLRLDSDISSAWQRAIAEAQALTVADTVLALPGRAPIRVNLHCAPTRAYLKDAPTRAYLKDAPTRAYIKGAPTRAYLGSAPTREGPDSAAAPVPPDAGRAPQQGTSGEGSRPESPAPPEMAMLVQIAPLDPRSLRMGAPTRKAARSAIGMAEMLAHEIKNPLAGITGAAQLLAMHLPPEDRELTGLIVAECRRVTALLAQVEQFGNVQPPARAPVNLHDVLDRARRSASLGFAAHMEIIADYDPSLPEAHVDRDQMLQVVLNLLKNAAEAAPGGGRIRLRSFYDARLSQDGTPVPLHIEVIDDGPGLPPDIAEHVFDPFVSGRENGTGLGLALVSKLVGENGGMVSVDSHAGETRFRLSLPRAPDVMKPGD